MERKAQLLRDVADEDRQLAREEAERKWRIPRRGEIEGLACVFNVIDTHGARFLAGCFKHAKASEVDYLFDHERTFGVTAEVRCVYEITRKELPGRVRAAHPEATGGLVVVRKYRDDGNGPSAKVWLHSGRITGLSVGFADRKTRPSIVAGRTVTDIIVADLASISDTENPAVPGVMAICGNHHLSLLEGRYRR